MTNDQKIGSILCAVMIETGCSLEGILSKDRSTPTVVSRIMLSYFLKKYLPHMNLSAIARYLRKTHTMTAYYLREFEMRYASDCFFQEQARNIETQIKESLDYSRTERFKAYAACDPAGYLIENSIRKSMDGRSIYPVEVTVTFSTKTN